MGWKVNFHLFEDAFDENDFNMLKSATICRVFFNLLLGSVGLTLYFHLIQGAINGQFTSILNTLIPSVIVCSGMKHYFILWQSATEWKVFIHLLLSGLLF